MKGPAKTSLGRFGAAFAIAAAASVCLPFLVTPIIIMATGVREQGMAIGVSLGIMVGWFIFPFVAWRPFRAVHLLALPIVALAAFAGLTILPEHWLTSPDGDRNGIFGAMINYGLCVLAVYGGLTWSRNILLRAGSDSSQKELSLLDRPAVEFVKTVRPRFGRLWRTLRSRGKPDE
jgi:hypothetical protein